MADTLDGMSVADLDALIARAQQTREAAFARAQEEAGWKPLTVDGCDGVYRFHRAPLEVQVKMGGQWSPSAHNQAVKAVLGASDPKRIADLVTAILAVQ